MSSHIDVESLRKIDVKKVWRVADFARRFDLCAAEEKRLLKLLGSFASEHELRMNSKKSSRFR